MRLLLLVCGCTLIVGDRRGPVARDMAGADGSVADGGGGLGGCTAGSSVVVEGSNIIPQSEAADVADVGDGHFAVAFVVGMTVRTTIMDSGGDLPTLAGGHFVPITCSVQCADARVAGPAGGSVWVSGIDGLSTTVQQIQISSGQRVGSPIVGACAGTVAASTALGMAGGDVVSVTSCTTAGYVMGSSIPSPLPFAVAGQAREVRLRNAGANLLSGWVGVGGLSAGAVLVQPDGRPVGTPVNLVTNSGQIFGLALDVLDGTKLLAAYAAGTQAEIAPAELDGTLGTKVSLGPAASASAQRPLGVAAGRGYFVVTYTEPMPTTHVVVRQVSADGSSTSAAVTLASPWQQFSPRIAYSPDTDRFALVYVGPMGTMLSERLAHMATLKCQ